MFDPNEKGNMYYGTDFSYILDLDKFGLDKPRHRSEQYISVSVSGYTGMIKCEHPELAEMARVFSQELRIADIQEGVLYYKPGYVNSITYQQGFGVNPNQYFHCYYGLINNTHNSSKVTLVISKSAKKNIVIPDEEKEFQHLSTALHAFLSRIDESDIIGWILPDSKITEVKKMMNEGRLKQRYIWPDTEFGNYQYDTSVFQRFGMFPSDLSMYLNGLSKDNCYHDVRVNHLKAILSNVVDVNSFNEIESGLKEWLKINADKIVWNSHFYKYKWR